MKLKIFLFIKRLIDIIYPLTILIFFFPILMVICTLIKLDSRGPIVIKNKMIGKDGAPFNLLSFRIMDIYTSKITKVGHILMYTKLTELPQFINVLKGEMSLIGPRPAHQYEVEHYNEWQKKRLNCKPGLSGYAQVYSYHDLSYSFENRIKLDIEYVENRSLFLDLKIIYLTVKVVFFGKEPISK